MEVKCAIGYIRVSTARQADDGIGLETQEGKIKAWSVLSGVKLVETHVDKGISGKRADNRPALNAALDSACEKKAILVVYSLSRLARSTRDAMNISERLDKAGADLVSLSENIDTTSAAGKMIFRMLSVLAEFERDQISERTKAALQYMKSTGMRVGSIPYGYDAGVSDDLPMIENQTEQRVIRSILEWREAGATLRGIISRLKSDGVRTKKGRNWSPKVVSSIIRAYKVLPTDRKGTKTVHEQFPAKNKELS